MDVNYSPHTPRPLSVILLTCTVVASIFEHITHSELNSWIATIAGVAALINYGVTWYFKIKKYLKSKKQ